MVNVVITEIKTKEVIMPRGDKTGPEGFGPMTGRRMGSCVGNVNPGSYNNPGFGTGFGRGMRNGFGRGFARGGGRGFGRNFTYPENQNFSNKEAIENEINMLKEQLSFLGKELEKLS